MAIELQGIAASMGSALVYSLIFYAKKRASTDKEAINFKKLGATIVVGGIIGAMYGYYGMPIEQATISEKLVTYAGTIALVESGIKTAYRMAKSYMESQE